MISSPGVGSGLDVNSIITQLMNIERKPLNDLQQRKTDYQAQISAYGRLKNAMAELQDSLQSLRSQVNFNAHTAVSSDPAVFTASASGTAPVTSYDIEVIARASNHKLASAGFADSAATVGQGTLTISVGGSSFDVPVNDSNDTLGGISNAINNATGNSIVKASIVNVDDGAGGTIAKLVLTAQQGGDNNTISVAVDDSDGGHTDNTGLSQLAYNGGTQNLSQIAEAKSAQIKVDTMLVRSNSNVFTGSIPGVTLTIGEEDPGVIHTLSVGNDDQATRDNINKFIDSFNKLRTTINDLQAKDLQADNTLRYLESKLHDVLSTPATGNGGNLDYLSQIGILVQKDGSLRLEKPASLDAALQADPDNVAKLFNADGSGFAQRFYSLTDSYLAVDGLIKDRTDGIDARIDSLEKRMNNLEFRLQQTQQRYQAQFTALDTLIGQMNSTSNYLTNQLELFKNNMK